MEGESPTLIFKTCVLSNTLGQNLHSLPLIGFYYLFSCWITATQKLWIYNACLGQLKPTAVWNTKKRNYTISSYGKSYSKIYIKLMSICFFHWCLTSKKSKWDIKSVERYQRLKNTQLWLPEIIFGPNLRTRFFPDMWFELNVKRPWLEINLWKN